MYAREAVKVDTDKFEMKKYSKWFASNGQNLPIFEPVTIFWKMLMITGMMVFHMIVSRPWKIYYDWEDPLI